RFLVTVRWAEGLDVEQLTKVWDRSPELTRRGPGFLLYGVLDELVDGYYDVVQAFDDFYDEVSERIFVEHPVDLAHQRAWFQMRQALGRFHRIAAQLRDATSALLRREHDAIGPSLYPYFQDVHDHVLRVTEATDNL